MKNGSLAMELLNDYKKTNKRQFIIILVILTMWFASIGIFIYYINTTGYEVITETAETTDSGNACVGDNCNNGEINYGKGK
jgi:flagellar biosynthesis/type III secretory pathway M-ring protein FliF/YscJ